jgi:hypothetical protein
LELTCSRRDCGEYPKLTLCAVLPELTEFCESREKGSSACERETMHIIRGSEGGEKNEIRGA